MLTRRFGRTNLAMPVLTLGGMRYQESWDPAASYTEENQANIARTVHRALELGIVHIETARGYGTSEKQLGAILPELPRDKLLVQTKVAPTEDPAHFERDFFDSLGRLRLQHVDLLALHGLNDRTCLDWSLREGGCLERALALKERGLVRHIGFSTHGALEVVRAAIEDGRFEYVNLHYYWAFQQNLSAVRAAAARDLGVLVISPNDKGGRLYDPPEKLKRLSAPLSPMVYNDLFCLACPELSTLSIGASRPEDLDEHVRAVELFQAHATDPRALIAPIEARLEQELVSVLGAAWVDGTVVGIPPWEQLPGGVNVREILRLYALVKGLDMLEYGRMRYNLLENGGHWFPGRTAAELDPAALTRALAGHTPLADRIPEMLREAHALLAGPKKQRLQQG